LEDSFRLSWW